MQKSMNVQRTDGGSVTVALPGTNYVRGIQDFRNIRSVLSLPDPEAATRQIYFMYCAGFVKIGTSRSILRRASNLQIGSPWKAQIVTLIPGGRRREAFLHFRLREHRVGGEWFRLAPAVRQVIQELTPAEYLQWLNEEEDQYKEWIRQEAIVLGLIKEP